MEPFHAAGDMHKAQKRDVELVIAGGHAAKDLHALEKVFHQVARLVAVRVQDARVLFAVDPARDDDLHATLLCCLNNLVTVVGFVSQKCLGLQPIEQLGHRFGVVALPGGQHKAQRVAQGVAHSVDFGIEPAARDADGLRTAGFSRPCRGLVRTAARRVHHHLFHVGLLHTLEETLEMAFFAPIRIALVHHVPCAQPLGQVAPGRARAGHP